MEQMQSDEQMVRGVWEQIDGDAAPDFIFIRMGRKWFQQNSWSAAAAFTRERLEEVRQIKREIEWIREFLPPWNDPHGVLIQRSGDSVALMAREDVTGYRIIGRLEAILADKTSGMKAGTF